MPINTDVQQDVLNITKNKADFENLVRTYIKREGVDALLKWLEKSDFYTAPATSQYLFSVEGGLCQYSMLVFKHMYCLACMYYGTPTETGVFGGESEDDDGAFSMESLAIVALFHAIYKVNCYVRDFKNVKVNGRWEQQSYWRWDEDFVYGRGAKSVYILQQFMRLYIDEAQAIRFHTAGAEDPLSGTSERLYQNVFDSSKFAVLLHLATVYTTWLGEGPAPLFFVPPEFAPAVPEVNVNVD